MRCVPSGVRFSVAMQGLCRGASYVCRLHILRPPQRFTLVETPSIGPQCLVVPVGFDQFRCCPSVFASFFVLIFLSKELS